jgi:malate permease and related proteins
VSQILDSLAPIFLVVALGAALVRGGLLGPEVLKSLNRLVYWVALPALLFGETARADLHGAGVERLVIVMCGATVPVIVLGIVYARLARLTPAAAGTFVHVAMRGNLAYVGLPVLLYLAAVAGPAAPRPAQIILAFAPFVLFQNVVSILLLLAGRKPFGPALVRDLAREIVTNPLLVAVGLGLLASLAGLRLPPFLAHTLDAVGALASPLALIGIGGSLLTVPLRDHWGNAAAGAVLKVAAVPLAGLLLGHWLGLPRGELVIALVFLACPTAVASHPLVIQLDGDEALASTAIVLSTLFSAVSLALIVAAA